MSVSGRIGDGFTIGQHVSIALRCEFPVVILFLWDCNIAGSLFFQFVYRHLYMLKSVFLNCF